jgi:hypothetical protein
MSEDSELKIRVAQLENHVDQLIAHYNQQETRLVERINQLTIRHKQKEDQWIYFYNDLIRGHNSIIEFLETFLETKRGFLKEKERAALLGLKERTYYRHKEAIKQYLFKASLDERWKGHFSTLS